VSEDLHLGDMARRFCEDSDYPLEKKANAVYCCDFRTVSLLS